MALQLDRAGQVDVAAVRQRVERDDPAATCGTGVDGGLNRNRVEGAAVGAHGGVADRAVGHRTAWIAERGRFAAHSQP